MTALLKNAGIYVLRNRDNGNCYVGKDTKLGTRAKKHLSLNSPNCRAIHNAIKKYGADNFDVELIPYPNISDAALYEVEKWKIKQLGSHHSEGGYNLTQGGGGLDFETNSKIQRKRIEAGTHPFIGGEVQRANNRKRVKAGTHHFLDSKFQSEISRKRVKAGTHNFIGGDIARKAARKRLEAGTHPFLRQNNPNARPEYYQVYIEFVLSLPLGIEKARQYLYEKFSDIPKMTIYRWVRQWTQ